MKWYMWWLLSVGWVAVLLALVKLGLRREQRKMAQRKDAKETWQ
jgi:hypothetical protein